MDLKERALKVRLLVLDVDGVLTDGRLYYTSRGEEIKGFNVKDGFGIKMAQMAGIRVGVISGRKSKALGKRLEELGIEEAHLGFNENLPSFNSMYALWLFATRSFDVSSIPPKSSPFPVVLSI